MHRKLTCSCLLIPEDRWNEGLQIPGVTPEMLAQLHDLWSAPRSRTWARLSNPDAEGHVHYIGKLPPDRAMPRVGRARIPLILWLRAQAGRDANPDIVLQRWCGDTFCFAVDHWDAQYPNTRERAAQPKDFVSPILLAVWDQDHPRPNPRLHKWDMSGPVDRCLAYGHPVTTHRVRHGALSAYCHGCYELEKNWKRERRDYKLHLGEVAQGLPPYPEERAILARNAERAVEAADALPFSGWEEPTP